MFKRFLLFSSLVLLQLFSVQPTLATTSNLTVRLIDHVSNAWLSGQGVQAWEKQTDGSLVYRATRTTDTNGLAWFDLVEPGAGKVYVLKAQPFGYWVQSD
ncbi:hypothetical protein, partial [Thiobacillus sp.]|uniref:hypothetical protein n=1 Tax=Thiobacillus sp. TaxID=924 RepID=UPI00286D6F72